MDTAREAFLLGAYDFVQKPFDNDLLKETVARALRKISLVKEKEALLEENKALIQGQRTRGSLGNIIGLVTQETYLFHDTVRANLFEAGLLVVSVLFLFLGNLRAAFIVALAIPLSMLFAFAGMQALAAHDTSTPHATRVFIDGVLGAVDFRLVAQLCS